MRIWDLNPGYLNRQSLLGEHRELHGIVSIILHNKKGYAHHPETVRWREHGWGLKQRHRLLVAEMNLRGYKDRSPVLLKANPGVWPDVFLASPAGQIAILGEKYKTREAGRIPLPKNAQYFWAHHKYSVMARDIGAYKKIGKWVTAAVGAKELAAVASELTTILRKAPEQRLIENALRHMWGYVSKYSTVSGREIAGLSMASLLQEIQRLALANNVKYLIESTAISELAAWQI